MAIETLTANNNKIIELTASSCPRNWYKITTSVTVRQRFILAIKHNANMNYSNLGKFHRLKFSYSDFR